MEPDSSSPTPPPSQPEETPVLGTPETEGSSFNDDSFADKEPSSESTSAEAGMNAPELTPAPASDASTTPLPSTPDVVTSTTPSVAPVVGTIASAPKKKSRKMLLIILIVVVLVVIALGAYIYAMS